MEVNIYIDFWTLEMKCTQYKICEEVSFKNAMVFLEVGRGKQKFSSRSKKSQFFLWGSCPCLDLPPMKGS